MATRQTKPKPSPSDNSPAITPAASPVNKALSNSGVTYSTVGTSTDTPERFKLGEAGYTGLNVINGVTTDEVKRELSWPHSISTYKQMSIHSAITAPLTLYENIISKATYKFIPPVNPTAEELQQTKVLNEMLGDMEIPFAEFIRDVLSMNVYGFSVHEKVFRRRLKENGSKYNDGLIGWKKLPIRNQETISKFIFSDNGNEITGVKQDLSMINDVYNRYNSRLNKDVVLPRKKFLHFRAGRHKQDPFGKSMLRDAYLAWRYLTALEEIEANGVAKDLNGVVMVQVPPQYMAADASPEMKAAYETFKNIARNLHVNQQTGVVFPLAYDPETRQPLFKLDLLEGKGSKSFDTTKVKEYYKNLIFTSMMADILTIGQANSGSFALAQVKNSLTGSTAEAMLGIIVEVINQDLVRHTYELNNWDTSRMATFEVDNLESEDLETFSRAFQRAASVGVIEVDREFLNRVRTSMGVAAKPDDVEPMYDYMPNFTSRSGDGLATAGEGTSTTVSGENAADNNLANTG